MIKTARRIRKGSLRLLIKYKLMKYPQKNIKGLFLSFMYGIAISVSLAQETKIIRLLDKDSSMPIIGATFEYGQQQGTTDENGNLAFLFKEGTSMYLSHINYGKWIVNEAGVLKMVQENVLYRQALTVHLYPVTVLALRPNEKPANRVTLDYQEQLAHDGAAILHQNPALNSIRKGGNYGFDPVFRGFKYDQLNIVLNGAQGATAACPNRMDPPTSQMSPNTIDRIDNL